MALIEWNESMSVGIAEIDEQHQKLVCMINDLNEAMLLNDQSRDNVSSGIISSLVQYAGVHFQTEEDYFEQFNYPDSDSHKNEHQQFICKTVDFIEKDDGGQTGLTLDLLNFLSTWLVNHIMKTDKDYSQFLNDHGVR